MKTSAITMALCATLMASLLASCGGGGGGGGVSVTFTNESSYVFNEIYLTPTESDEWGGDLLGGTNILKSGGSHDITLASASNGLYDIMAIDEDGDSWQFDRVPLEKGSTVVIHGDGTAVSTSPDGTETTVSGELVYSNQGLDEGGGLSDDPPAMADWIDMTFHNDSGYDFHEVYVFQEGVTDDEDIGYNHIAEHGTLSSMTSTGLGVENYEYFDLILVDEDADRWYFTGVYLEEGCQVHIYIDEDAYPTLAIHYGDGSGSSNYYGEYL